MELPALGIALLVLTGALVVGVSVAHSSLGASERPALEQRTAVGLSDRLIEGDAPTTHRENVVNDSALQELSGSTLRQYGLPAGADVRVKLGDSTVVSNGTVESGTTIERIVLVENRDRKVIEPTFDRTNAVTLPRRTANATVIIEATNTTVRQVQANDRVVLDNSSGLNGTFEVSLSRRETITLQFDAAGALAEGDVRIVYYPTRTRKATLGVTVDG